jgi:hypothetical protein
MIHSTAVETVTNDGSENFVSAAVQPRAIVYKLGWTLNLIVKRVRTIEGHSQTKHN